MGGDYAEKYELSRIMMSVSVCMSVCLPVCMYACMYGCRLVYFENYTSKFHQILCMLPVTVARSCSGGVAIRYVRFRFYG